MKPKGPGRRNGAIEDEIRVGFKMAGIGMEVASQVLGGVLLGWLFDYWQGTAPKGAYTGAIIGIVVALSSLIRGTLKLNAQLEKRHPTAGRGKPLPFPDEPDEEDKKKDDDGWPDDEAHPKVDSPHDEPGNDNP